MREITLPFIVIELSHRDLLPAIVFRSARNQCDDDVEQVAKNSKLWIDKDHQNKITQKINEVVGRYDLDHSLILSHPQYASLIKTAVGAHHAGQLLVWRLVLEELMAASLLRILVATGTVAAGVDFPARTVIVTAHSRRGATGFQKLSSSEFQQMSGRAGRRGKDTIGFCLAAPTRFCDARVLRDISKRPPEPLQSSYFPGPSTVLNLLRYRTVDGLRYTVERSFASYMDVREAKRTRAEAAQVDREVEAQKGKAEQDVDRIKKMKKRARRLARNADELEVRQQDLLESSLRGLTSLSYVVDDKISEKGSWAANLCTTLVIELAEMVEDGIFETTSLEDLVSRVACIAGDAHRSYIVGKDEILSRAMVEQIESVLKKVQDTGMPGLSDDREVVVDAARTVLLWMKAENWNEFRGLLVLSGVAEGDAARLITQTAEQLNQLARLEQTHPKLASRAQDARGRLLRPPLTEAVEFSG